MNDKFTRKQKKWLLNLKDFLNPKSKLRSYFFKHMTNVQRKFKKRLLDLKGFKNLNYNWPIIIEKNTNDKFSKKAKNELLDLKDLK